VKGEPLGASPGGFEPPTL